jgi:two-component system response regulator AtoC
VRVLWIDDEIRQGDALLQLLADKGILVDIALTGAEGLRKAQATVYDVIVLDLRLPDMFGISVLQRLIASGVTARVIVSSGWYLEPEVDEEARRLGAVVVHKPLIDIEELVSALRGLAEETRVLDRAVSNPPHGIVGVSAATRETIAWVERIASSNVGVLLTGETGTGKEVVALAIHRASARRDRPFLPVNCGAIPDALFESELFGHRKGAFTGASEDKPGLVERAEGGTLFLDEIGEMPLAMQVRLLRCLDGGHVRRVGETRERTIDVRVIAATNRDARKEVAAGRFREDLYFRLGAAHLHLTPLRQRPDDVEALVGHWLPRLAQGGGTRTVTISPDAMAALRTQPWPGNARELRNVLEYALCLATGPALTRHDVSTAMSCALAPISDASDASEKGHRAKAALDASGGSRSKAARRLGISRTTLWRWITGGG